MPQITLRIEQELYDSIEEMKGEKDRSAFLREVIIAYFASQRNANASQEKADDSQEKAGVSQLHYENEYLKKKLDEITALHEKAVALHSQEKQDLMKLISQEQSLHLQTQRQLMPTPQEITNKSWWHFWKK
jgi:metal-responsive CopG/Arc/MetJ family transcriptional regulator